MANTATNTYLQNLIQAQANIAKLIADVSSAPHLDYSIDGETLSWSSYLSMLLEKQETLDKTIQRAQSPFSRVSRGTS